MTTHFIVDVRALYTGGGGHIKACVSNPSGSNTATYITDKGNGTYRVEYTPYEDGETPLDRVHHQSCDSILFTVSIKFKSPGDRL